jgi:hypothetical protein
VYLSGDGGRIRWSSQVSTWRCAMSSTPRPRCSRLSSQRRAPRSRCILHTSRPSTRLLIDARTCASEESGAEVPLPPRKQEADSALKEYAEGLCTRKADVLEVTYKPLPAFTVRRHAEEPAVTTSASGDAAGNGATVS